MMMMMRGMRGMSWRCEGLDISCLRSWGLGFGVGGLGGYGGCFENMGVGIVICWAHLSLARVRNAVVSL